eukprot:356137-Chlamydomonas_euryale.AAC.2
MGGCRLLLMLTCRAYMVSTSMYSTYWHAGGSWWRRLAVRQGQVVGWTKGLDGEHIHAPNYLACGWQLVAQAWSQAGSGGWVDGRIG